jgi:SIT family siderophore-iron:H+ symporter-like MFS transporter
MLMIDIAIFIILIPIFCAPIVLVLWRGTRAPRIHRAEVKAAKRGNKFTLARLRKDATAVFWQVS